MRGEGHFDNAKCFLGNSEKTPFLTRAVFCIPSHNQFRTLPENFSTRSSQVRLPDQVKWPCLKKYLGFSRDYSFWDININVQELIRAAVPTTLISRNFDFGDLRSGQFCDFTIIRQWEMFICRFFPKVRVGTCYLSQDIATLGPSRWPACSFEPMTSPSDHSRSYEVTFVFCL